MKNNILLILAVTVISIGIIVATVLISGAGSGDNRDESSSSMPKQTTVSTTTAYIPPTEEAPLANTPVTTEPAETSATVEIDEDTYDSATADSIISTAHSLIGIDFADGGDTPGVGFDNSGFIYYVLRENGYITCPRGLRAQSEMGTALTYDELRKGDLAFFYSEDKSSVAFGGIYCGDGIMIACLMPGTQVKEINITSPYYTEYFCKGISIT